MKTLKAQDVGLPQKILSCFSAVITCIPYIPVKLLLVEVNVLIRVIRQIRVKSFAAAFDFQFRIQNP